MPKEIHPYAVILQPLVTEKSTILAGQNQVRLRGREGRQQDTDKAGGGDGLQRPGGGSQRHERARQECDAVAAGPRAAPDWKKAIVTLAGATRSSCSRAV